MIKASAGQPTSRSVERGARLGNLNSTRIERVLAQDLHANLELIYFAGPSAASTGVGRMKDSRRNGVTELTGSLAYPSSWKCMLGA
jgi:hypothetical protein